MFDVSAKYFISVYLVCGSEIIRLRVRKKGCETEKIKSKRERKSIYIVNMVIKGIFMLSHFPVELNREKRIWHVQQENHNTQWYTIHFVGWLNCRCDAMVL